MAKYRSVQAKVLAAKEGESMLDKYEAQEEPSLYKEVSEAEYQRIVAERRGEFVVDSTGLGYEDTGREIWEDREALREFQREKQRKVANVAKQSSDKQAPAGAPEGSKNILSALSAGARGVTAAQAHASPSARGQPHQQQLDGLLSQLCGEIDSADSMKVDALPGRSAASVSVPKLSDVQPKRKVEAAAVESSGSPEQKRSKNVQAAAVPATLAAPVVPPVNPTAEPAPFKPMYDATTSIKAEMQESPPKTILQEPPIKQEPAKKEPMIKAEPVDQVVAPSPEAEMVIVKEELQSPAKSATMFGTSASPDAIKCNGAGGPWQVQNEKDGALWFFFMDAVEEDRASPPRVYLFGKVRTVDPRTRAADFQSCCLVVEQLERCFHLLLNVPDQDCSDEQASQVAQQAHTEFVEICRKQHPGVRVLRSKLKRRNYAFEKPLQFEPGELPFLKVVCDGAGSHVSSEMTGEHFSRIFGAQSSLLERLVLTRRIMGPSWLRLQPGSFKQADARLSFCNVEFRITPHSITAPKRDAERKQLTDMGMPLGSPPMRVLSLSMQTTQRSAQHGHEPVAIACTLHPFVNCDAAENDKDLRQGMEGWAAVRRCEARPFPRDAETMFENAKIKHYSSESSMLCAFLAKIQEFDPDVIVGHNAYGFDMDVLISRIAHNKINVWQKLGRLRRSRDRMPPINGRNGGGFWMASHLTAGRLICDVMLQAKDLLPKLVSYSLPSLAQAQLNLSGLYDVEPEQLYRFFDSAQGLVELCNLTYLGSLSLARLAHSLQILPLSKQLTNLAGNLWNMSLQNRRAERNEMLLCHEFHNAKFVLPDKESALMKKRRQQVSTNAGFDDPEEQGQDGGAVAPSGRRGKAAYSGGLVLEPKVGLYDEFVMMLDFNSLYPSVIQEYNICFTTVERPDEKKVTQVNSEADLLAQTHLPDGTVDEGVLPQVLRRLVESRKSVKFAIKSEKDPKRSQMLDIRQKALKLTANSMYGCLGFQNSRFYAKPLAALITAKGREALQSTCTVVQQELQLEIVYGDTDSVFVNTKSMDYDLAMQQAQKIKQSVNKRYRRLEIEVDGIFCRLLLLKKKKYAALKVVDWHKGMFERELKGLDVVRRDWCPLAKDLGDEILTQMLKCKGKEEFVHWMHEFLTEKGREIDGLKVPVERYVISKGLTKAPKDYPDAKALPHVQVALRMEERRKAVRAGQEIEYVICEPVAGAEGGPKASFASRARHPQELQMDQALRVDILWYKSQQIHPLISRLVGPIEGTDAARVAECLGMDGSRFAKVATASAAEGGAAEDDVHNSYVESVGGDIERLLDRNSRFKTFESSLPGVKCPKCAKALAWRQLLQPEVWSNNRVQALFRCDVADCNEPINPRVAQNLLVLQVRALLRQHSEGWVQLSEEVSASVNKTRRQKRGQNMMGERKLIMELEFIEHLTRQASQYTGADARRCVDAADTMHSTVKRLLDVHGLNWVDCGSVFKQIFGTK